MFSRLPMSSKGEVESVASSSALSTISTINQVGKCKEVLAKALNLKKLVSINYSTILVEVILTIVFYLV